MNRQAAVTAGGGRDLSVPRLIDRPASVMLAPDADLSVLDDAKILAAPEDPTDWPSWREALIRWRDEARRRRDYDPSCYERGAEWAASCRSVRLVWLWDERLYDRGAGGFTVEDFVSGGERDYGGFDAVVLWHAYPVIGLDPRNQWDFYRDVPDLSDLIARFHTLGLRVFVDYNPWDVGTRRSGRDDASELAALVADWAVDGVFLDTLKVGAPELIDGLARVGRPVALEGESPLPLEAVPDHPLSWAQWFADSRAPGVLRAHWYERRHMMHHTRRWNRDHSAELQSAWVNGCGVLVWDDVFGVWVGWNERDRSTLRAMRPLQRLFHRHFVEGEWTPLAALHPSAVEAAVFAHRYVLDNVTVWTAINRGENDYIGPVLQTPDAGTWFELAAGAEVTVDAQIVSTTVPGRGIACLVRVIGDPPDAIRERVAGQWSRVDTFPSRPARPASAASAPGRGPAADDAVRLLPGPRTVIVRYRLRETGQFDQAPWVDAWKPLPPELHAITSESRAVDLTAVAVDRLEVSNLEFHAFLTATGYEPAVAHRFLTHWVDGLPAMGSEDEPVSHIGLDDARAYAAWRGARLPSPAEWQVAMQEGAGRRQPLVWNWTEAEYTDGVTRFALLKGGSWFAAFGSDWYVDGGEQPPEWELKLVLPGGGLERSACVGFRCAVDLEA